MSKKNLTANGSELNNDKENFDQSYEWNYSDKPLSAYKKQNRICCSPTDEFKAMQGKQDENLFSMQSVEVQTEKSSLLLLKQEKKIDDNNRKNEFQMLDAYAETDLDQPMDYTLCCDEIYSDEEKKGNTSYLTKNNFMYINEAIGGGKTEAIKTKGAIIKEPTRNKKEMFGNTGRSFKEIFNFFKDRDKKRSLIEHAKASIIDGSKSFKSTENYGNKIVKLSQSTQLSSEQYEKERRSKIETQCSQPTPLMFSRCSSSGSLNGLEQNSINDDRSSLVSDVSLRTSGAVSPSELPDSPAQVTSPSSPAPKSQLKLGYFGKKKIQQLQDKIKVCQNPTISNENFVNSENNFRKLSIAKQSVFEDNLTAFKDESTPTKLDSVAASSLSSLTIDDDDDYELVNKIVLNKEKQNFMEDVKPQCDREEPIGGPILIESSIKLEKSETTSNVQDENFGSEENDKLTDLTPYEEKLLDECIRRGIAKWTKKSINEIKPFSWDLGLTCRTTRAMLTKIKLNQNIQNDTIDMHRYYNIEKVITNNNNSSFKHNYKSDFEILNHAENYSNEDINQTKEEPNLNNTTNHISENSYYVTYEEHLLDECIRRGMAKITKRNINDIKPFSWDKNHICLSTRAMILHGRDENIYNSY